ncbi:hypothetical protein JCM6882_007780 [Rhodosporidiobolus microsporus]
MTSDAATPDFTSLLSIDTTTTSLNASRVRTGESEMDFEEALRDMINSTPMSAPAQLDSFSNQHAPGPFTPASSSPSTPSCFSFSPVLGGAFPSSAAMSTQGSSSSTCPSTKAAYSLPSPASSLSASSPQALTRSPSAQSTSRHLSEQLESAVAILKGPAGKGKRRSREVYRAPAPRPYDANTLPLPLNKPKLPTPSISHAEVYPTFVLPSPAQASARPEVALPAQAALPVEPQQQSRPLFRPESPAPSDLPITPPSTSFLPPTSLPSTPVASIFVDDPVEEDSPAQSRRSKHMAKRIAEGYIPRPANAWMLYRSARVKEFAERERQGGSRVPMQSDLSKIIGEMWRAEPLDIRETYARLALAEREEHAKRYPHYVFKPVRRTAKRSSAVSSGDLDETETKRRRPGLKKSHTAPDSSSLLPSIELFDSPVAASFPSVLTPAPPTSASSVDMFEQFWTPPSTAASEAWTAFTSAPVNWHDSKPMDLSSLQLDFGPSCPSTPFSAPPTLSTFDFSFVNPSPPLIAVSSPEADNVASAVADLLKLDPALADSAPTALPSAPASDLSSSSTSSVLDEIMAALDRAPPPSLGSASSTSADTLVLPSLGTSSAPTASVSPMMSDQELQDFIAQFSTAP